MTLDTTSDLPKRYLSDSAVGWILFLAVGAIYAATVCRTIYTGDDGDFASAVATFGIPHPTGYPLFVLLGRLWVTLTAFLGSIPFRLNLFTAVCGAGAVAILFRFLSDLLAELPWRRIWAIVGALVFAFSPTMWNQSNSCEVYTLNVLFLGLLLWLCLRFIRTEPGDTANKILCQLALVYGLALTNHLTIALFFPAFMAVVVWRKPSLFGKDWQILLAVVGCLLLPLSLYIYLPLATKYSASPNKWGYPDTPERFWFHLTGGQYRDAMFQSTDLWKQSATKYLTELLPHEYGIPLLLVAAIGFGFLLWNSRTRVIGLLLAAIFLGDVLYSAGYSIYDIFVYYVPSYLVLAVSVAAAGALVVQLLEKRLGSEVLNRYSQLAFPVLLATLALHASMHYADADKSNNRAEADYAEGILRSCPPNAVLSATGSVTETLWYYQFVEKMRPDVLVISEDMFAGVAAAGGWYRRHLDACDPRFESYLPKGDFSSDALNDGTILRETLKNALRQNRPVVAAPFPGGEQTLSGMFDTVPWGLTVRLYSKGSAPRLDRVFQETETLWTGEKPALPSDWKRFVAVRGRDELQLPIFLRFQEAAIAWGKIAEASNRPDLAVPAYRNALALFEDETARAALERLQPAAKSDTR